jgi:hypothetical protein
VGSIVFAGCRTIFLWIFTVISDSGVCRRQANPFTSLEMAIGKCLNENSNTAECNFALRAGKS